MKRWITIAVLLLLGGSALYYSQRHKTDTHVGPESVLRVAAETQREISRVPMRVTRLSDEEERRIGDEIAQRYGYLDHAWNQETDAPVEQYVRAVGRQVAARAHRKLNYTFHYIPDPNFINAFALPGGHIYIGKGLIKLMDSEDELASVLGHEIEHVDQYHCNEKAQIEAAQRHLPLGELVTLPIELFQAGYSKDQELEADRNGTHLAVMAGYSAQGAVRMFQQFEKLERQYITKAETPQEELSQVAIDSISGYFRSHPLAEEREAQIKQMIISEKWPNKQERPLNVAIGGEQVAAN
jgi:predicted Zn-dependent protease